MNSKGKIKKKAVQTGMTHYRHHKKGNNSSGVTVNVHSIGKRDLLATALETPTLRIGEGNRPFLGFRSPLLFADEHFFPPVGWMFSHGPFFEHEACKSLLKCSSAIAKRRGGRD